MKNKASVLTIRVPVDLKQKIERVAEEQGISINQLAFYAFTKEIQELETTEYFTHYRGNLSKAIILDDFDSVMQKIKDGEIPEWDKIS